MKKLIFRILGAAIFCLILGCSHYDPEKELLKHLKKKYNKEFIVVSSIKTLSGEGNLIYDAEILPVEYLGTDKETEFYVTEAFIRGRNIKDEYINILAGESADNFYLPKLKEIFGENIFSVFTIEGDCEKEDIQEELARRKKIYEKNLEEYSKEKYPLMSRDFDPLKIKVYIFGNEKDVKNKEVYREKIYEFIEYLRETNAFEHTILSINIIDDKSFEKNTYEIILEKETEKIKEENEELYNYLISRQENPLSLANLMVNLTLTNPDGSEITGDTDEIKEHMKNRETKFIKELETKKKITKDNFKDLKTILEKLPKSTAGYIFNEYGKVLLSTHIISPKGAECYSCSGGGYVNLYERKEDICFEGEEQNYPDGTIKEMGEEYIYYITETKNNKKNGTSIQYDADGNILWEGEYKNNQLDGPFKKYEERWIEEGMYKNNLIEGEVKRTYSDGEIDIVIYKNGVKQKNQEE